MYIVLNPDGTLDRVDEQADAAAVRKVVGPPGFDMVRIEQHPDLYAFVNDEGLFDQAAHPRNIVGGCVLATLGAKPHIFAGRIIITGFDLHHAPDEIVDLGAAHVDLIETIHDYVQRALDGAHVSWVGAENWSDQVREYAAHARSAETPSLTWRAVEMGALGVTP